MCSSRKIKYESNLQADAYGKLYEIKYKHPFRSYPCPECKTWHLTTQVSKSRSNRSAEAKRRQKLRKRRREEEAFRNWENEGGSFRIN